MGDALLNNVFMRFPPTRDTGNPDALSRTRPPPKSRISQPNSVAVLFGAATLKSTP
jgi:hypothetical protein